MPRIYTVEIDGKQYDLEGDHEPTEADARAAIQSYQPPNDQPLSEKERATAGMRGLGEAARAVAPIFAAAGLAAAPIGGLAAGAGRLLSTPIGGAVSGAGVGYLSGGVPGALRGAVEGGVGGTIGKVGRLLTTMRGAGAATGAGANAARAALSSLPNTIIQSPEGFAMRDRLMALAKEEASRAGTVAAGTKARGAATLLEQLFGQ